ncbi:MAG: sulfotransferase domain-containing protein [Bacteroidetes bacterium]|nr:sulfotransferase domain-containing protein [Bacteroidota bacterium]
MSNPVPDFLIIGAAKSGTTSLIADLKSHPGIYTPGAELNYFSHFFGKGAEWYCSQFNQPGKIQGEKSTSYLYETTCHERIFQHNPGMKLIVLLREPVKRAFSNWTMRYMQSRLLKQVHTFNSRNPGKIENIGFSHLFHHYLSCQPDSTRRGEPLDIFGRGLYIEQIEHLLGIFPPEQLLILISEQYFQKPAESLLKVSRFFNISEFPAGHHAWKRKSSYPVKLDEQLAFEIHKYYKPFNERLFAFLGREIEEWQRK